MTELHAGKASRIAIALAPILLLLAVAGTSEASSPSSGSVPQPKNLVNSGDLTACADISLPPMEFYPSSNSTTPSGLDVNLESAAASLMGLKGKFVETQFPGLIPALTAHRCDVVWSAILISGPRTKATPAIPYMTVHDVIMVQGGNPTNIHTPADLSGKVVAVEAGTSEVTLMDSLNKNFASEGKAAAQIQTYPDATSAAEQLLTKRADAYVDLGVTGAYRTQVEPKSFDVVYKFPTKMTFGIYYNQADASLGTALTRALADMRTNGTFPKLLKKWNIAPSSANL
jgi:polar amino acid transport system substrate-binding protein